MMMDIATWGSRFDRLDRRVRDSTKLLRLYEPYRYVKQTYSTKVTRIDIENLRLTQSHTQRTNI